MKGVSIIIPCWLVDTKLLGLTQQCVESIRATSNVELILIDNGSLTGIDYLMEQADIYVRNKENIGYVKAMNQGWKLATSDYLVAGNNDFVMKQGWVEALKETLDIPMCGMACPHVSYGQKQDTYWTTSMPGGWYMMKRETLLQIGLLDERFFNTFADYDFAWRMKKKLNKSIVITPKVTVDHYGGATTEKFKQQQEEFKYSQNQLRMKYQGDEEAIHYFETSWW